jgi:hypothetical protein
MKDPFLLWALIVGVLAVIVYVIWSFIHTSQRPDLANTFQILTGSLGTSLGVKVCSMAISTTQLTPLADSERYYIVLGGVAAIWVSLQAIIKSFSGLIEKPKS